MKVDGHWTGVDVREGGTWKIRLATGFSERTSSGEQCCDNAIGTD
jgi:hypothetical protein